jgi:hypothetical protein
MRTWPIVALSIAAGTVSAAPCIPPDTKPVMMALDGKTLGYCVEADDELRCFTTDVATGQTTPAAAPPPRDTPWPRLAAAPPAMTRKNAGSGKKPQLCRPDGRRCKTLVMTHEIDPGMGLGSAHNATFTLAALVTLHWIDTFDLRTGKRLASFTTGPKRSSCNTVAFAGDTLVIGEQTDCASPARTAWLATPTGKKVADVGGDSPLVLGSMAHVSGSTYAFTNQAGDTLQTQDVVTGQTGKRYFFGPPATAGPAFLVASATTLALVYGGSRAGDVAFLDVATGKLSQYPARRCPGPTP